MIRIAILTVGFVGSTLALIWGLGGSDPSTPTDQVSRSGPDMLGLQPAVTPLAIPQPEPVVVAAPEIAPQPAPVPVAVATPAPAPAIPVDKAQNALNAMGYGILEELKKPVAPKAAPAPAPITTAAAEPAPQATDARAYTVQRGDSLPGIAFRFYGTTAAYPQIIEANAALIKGPSDLRPGMVLTIPE